MDFKTGAVIFCATLGLAVGVNQALQVKTPEDLQKYRQEQQVEQGSDAQEQENDRRRDQLRYGIDAENRERLVPGELRPKDEPKIPRLRLRP
jgi:hypothetical protein